MKPANRTTQAKVATDSNVVPFRSSADGQTSVAFGIKRSDDGIRGIILFFTGVRYERHEEAQLKSPRREASRSRRKRG